MGYKEISGQLDAANAKFAIVISRFNSFLTAQLLKGAVDCVVRHGGSEAAVTVVWVPGANEIPLVVERLAAAKKHDAVIALGAVIQGATPHADLINGTVARALSKIALDTGVPVLNGIVCAQSLEQAIERAGTKHGNKGWDAVMAAIETVSVLKAL